MDTSHYQKILLDLKHEVSGRISAIDRDIRHEGMSADWTEQASERENDEVLESLGNSSEQELSMINYALQRIEENIILIAPSAVIRFRARASICCPSRHTVSTAPKNPNTETANIRESRKC